MFGYPTFDEYWPHYILRRRAYEQSLERLFLKLAPRARFGFIDGGANFGYWSVLLSSKEFGSKPTVAVEASPETFAVLQRNALLNGGRFICVCRALSYSSAGTLPFAVGGRHAASRLLDPDSELEAGETVIRVPLTTISDIVASYFVDNGLLLVKLDVEGAEVAAIRSAPSSKCLFIYEDHGRDQQSLTSQTLHSMGFQLLYPTDDGELLTVDDLSVLKTIKRHRGTGYNLVAISPDSAWQPIVSSLLGNLPQS
jgi:FkbM family methyltransferase